MNVRTLALALGALLALSAMAAAEDSGSSGSGTSSTTTSEPSSTTSASSPTTSSTHEPSTTTTSSHSERPTEPSQAPPPEGGPGSPPPRDPSHDPQTQDCFRQARDNASRLSCLDQFCQRGPSDWCAHFCEEHPQKPYCAEQGQTTGKGPKDPPEVRDCVAQAGPDPGRRADCYRRLCDYHPMVCAKFCASNPEALVCAPRPTGAERHIDFDPAADGFANLTVGGKPVLDRVILTGGGVDTVSHDDHTLTVQSGNATLQLHDDPSAFLRFDGDATLTLVFPAGTTHTAVPNGFRIQLPWGGPGLLEAPHATWTDDRTVVLTGFASFHAAPMLGTGPLPPGPADPKVREKIAAATDNGHVGVEIRLDRGATSEVLAYDDVNVTLRGPAHGAAPTAADPLRVILSSGLHSGRTIALHLNRTLVAADGNVTLRYYDLPDGPNGTAKTQVVLQRASSLDDVLDPSNDNGQPEYWIVSDANGLEVLVSVPHWSAHMIELSSLLSLLPPEPPSVLIGLGVGVAGAVVAAVALFVPRRRDGQP